jgi:hypothetical protein
MATAPILCQAKTNAKAVAQIFSFFTRAHCRDTVNDLLQIGFSPAVLSSSTSASSFDLNNYTAIEKLRFPKRIGWI